MPSFSIGGFSKERLEIHLPRLPARTKTAGEDWVAAKVKVDVGAFTGELEISIWLSDVISFKEQLEPVYRDLKGVAEFTTIEEQLFIRIELDRLGHVLASGHIVDAFDHGNKLNFNIQYDQTLLFHTIVEIDELLFEFNA